MGMNRADFPLYAFNRGLVSPFALARTDLKRMALSASQQDNWMPRLLGSMMMRPGLGYKLGSYNNNKAVYPPFIFSTSDVALLECTDSILRPIVNEAPITRVSVSTAVTNGTFAGNITGWTTADESGATSAYGGANNLSLIGNGTAYAITYQQVTVGVSDQGKEHALRIVVQQESVILRVGSTLHGDDYVKQHTLGQGTHSIALTPTGNFYIEFRNASVLVSLVSNCTVEAAGVLTLPTPWTAAKLPLLRWDQSGDIVYIACDGLQQRKILRPLGSNSTRSWSIVLYAPEDGPFMLENTGPVTISASGFTGSITLTASEPLFYSTQVGALFRLASFGQSQTVNAGGTNQFCSAVKVTGIGGGRALSIAISGTWNATVVLQRATSPTGPWSDVSAQSWTSNINTSYTDGLDNQIIYYRIGIEGTYTSGTAVCTLFINSGSQNGIVRITAFGSSTSVTANVLVSLGATTATSLWWEGQWSDKRGWPTSVAFHEGRLFWAGRNAIVGSVSDAFESFDDTITGDSGVLNFVIGSGPVDVINFLLPLQRMVMGAQGKEISVRSSSIDTPLTPTSFVLKDCSTYGSAALGALKIDTSGVFVDRSTYRLYELIFNPQSIFFDYSADELTKLVPDIALSQGGFTKIVVQRKPDTRVHALRADGTVAVLVYDPAENEHAWVTVSTPGAGGFVEDIVVLPTSTPEDAVYYSVKRTVGGVTVRYLERWAMETEAQGAALNKVADSFVTYTGVAANVLTAIAPHLAGQTVVIWGNTDDLGTAVVANDGSVTIPNGVTVTNAVVGLAYTAQFQSTKLAYAAKMGTAINQQKKVDRLGFVLAYARANSVQYGPDFNSLSDIPLEQGGNIIAANTIYTAYDEPTFEFDGEWSTDQRLCLQCAAPRPCTVLGAVIEIDVEEQT